MKLRNIFFLVTIICGPGSYAAEETALQRSDKEMFICHERSGLLKIARSIKMNDKDAMNKVFDNKECSIAPKGTTFKVLEVEQVYTLIEIHDKGMVAKLWTFHLK